MFDKSNRLVPAARLELLESRRLLAGNVLQSNLVSDLPGVAAVTDPNLVNPWGISESSGSPFWISDNGTGVSTLYNVPGVNNTHVSINPLVVSIPSPTDPLGDSGTPTGTVFNIDGGGSGGFKVNGVDKNNNPTSAASVFLFATEDGTIVGWNPGVNPAGFDPSKAGTYGTIAKDNSPDGAVYKGLTIASGAGNPIASTDPKSTFLLYAANFHSGKIEVYNPDFSPATLPAGAFTDPDLPKGYAPFNVQQLDGKIYVTYAKQDKDVHDDVTGEGHGFVDVFNLDGTPGLSGGKVRLISRHELNSPWGLAIAPDTFGPLADDLLVGNFGDGHINVFNSTTGAFVTELKDPDGEAIHIDGLWALSPGNGAAGGDEDDIYFTSGPFHESHGLFGELDAVDKGTPEGDAEAQTAQAFLDVAQIALTTVQTDLANHVGKHQLKQDREALEDAIDGLERADHTLDKDIHKDGGATTLEASVDASIDQFLKDLHKLNHHLHG